MTQVTFHVNAPDPTAYTCRLLRKAASLGAKVMVTGAPDALDRLDLALWTFAPLEFVPHCRSAAPASVLQASPIVLSGPREKVPGASVLLHLGGPAPENPGQFEKIIEVVGQGMPDLQEARQRWKLYAGQGYDMVHHEVTQ